MHSDHIDHTLPIIGFEDMETVPLQATYQSAIQSVIISGNENRRIRIELQGIHFTFTESAGLADRRVRGCAETTTLSPIRSFTRETYLVSLDCAIGLGRTRRKLRGGEAE